MQYRVIKRQAQCKQVILQTTHPWKMGTGPQRETKYNDPLWYYRSVTASDPRSLSPLWRPSWRQTGDTSRWWRQTWHMTQSLTIVSQSYARIGIECGMNYSFIPELLFKVWVWMSNYIPYKTMDVVKHDLILVYVDKRPPDIDIVMRITMHCNRIWRLYKSTLVEWYEQLILPIDH